MDAMLEQAIEVANTLQQSLEDYFGKDARMEETPYISVTWTQYTLAVSLDEHCLWEDQIDNSEDLTVACLTDRVRRLHARIGDACSALIAAEQLGTTTN